MNTPKCSSCSKEHLDVRCMVFLGGNLHLCDECITLCAEIVGEMGDGMASVPVRELEELRIHAQKAKIADIWVKSIRDALDRADQALNPAPAEKGGAA